MLKHLTALPFVGKYRLTICKIINFGQLKVNIKPKRLAIKANLAG